MAPVGEIAYAGAGAAAATTGVVQATHFATVRRRKIAAPPSNASVDSQSTVELTLSGCKESRFS